MVSEGRRLYAKNLTLLDYLAVTDLQDWWSGHNRYDRKPSELLNEAYAPFYDLVKRYGSIATQSAVDYLIMERHLDQELRYLPKPDRAEVATFTQASSSLEWAIRSSIKDGVFDDRVALKKLCGVVNRLVLQPARETVWNATVRDGTRYARVPEPGACPFCLMLASRGAVYTRDTVTSTRQLRAYHDNCRCLGIESANATDGDPFVDLPPVNRELRQMWDAEVKDLDSGPAAQRSQWAKVIGDARAKAQSEPVPLPPRAVFAKGEQTRRWKDLQSTPRLGTPEGGEAYERANPDFARIPVEVPEGMDLAPWKENCVRCVNAAELRRRGYDVTAGSGLFNSPNNEWNSQYALNIGWRNRETGKPPVFVTIPGDTKRADDSLLRAIRRNSPEGARGFVTGSWYSENEMRARRGDPLSTDPADDLRRGHIWSWEKTGGKIVFSDPQTGRRRVPQAEYLDNQAYMRGSLTMVRIDDCDPVDDVLDVLGGDLDQWQ